MQQTLCHPQTMPAVSRTSPATTAACISKQLQRRALPLGLGPAASRPLGCRCTCSAISTNVASTSSPSPVTPEVTATAAMAVGHQQQLSASAAAAPPAPFAAFRMLLTGQNTTNYFRQTLQQAGSKGGPISLLLFALTLVAAAFAALRSALVRKVKGCTECRGYGVTRCRLCNGAGRVDWAAKLSHYAACPLCMNRRYIVCSECGGGYHRPLFSHIGRRQGSNQDLSDLMGTTAAGAAVGAAAAAAAGAVPVKPSGSPMSSLGSPLSSLDLSEGVASARND